MIHSIVNFWEITNLSRERNKYSWYLDNCINKLSNDILTDVKMRKPQSRNESTKYKSKMDRHCVKNSLSADCNTDMLKNIYQSEESSNDGESVTDMDDALVRYEYEPTKDDLSDDFISKDDKTEENVGFNYIMPGPSNFLQVQISTDASRSNETTVSIEDITENGDRYLGHQILEGKKTIQCPVCFKIYTKKSSLKSHKLIHSDTGTHECVFCKKTFSTSKVLKQHMRLHTGECFSCEVCRKQFVQMSNLRRHMGTHSDERPFHCKDCDKKFKFQSGYNDHLKKHISSTDQKFYNCATCPKKFTLFSSFRKHQLKFNHRLQAD